MVTNAGRAMFDGLRLRQYLDHRPQIDLPPRDFGQPKQ